jgi:hypothetical protein
MALEQVEDRASSANTSGIASSIDGALRPGSRARPGQILRGADAGDDVLALGVDQILAIIGRSPLAGSRVKATPVAEVSPILPNTIAWTLTAVPQSAGMSVDRR